MQRLQRRLCWSAISSGQTDRETDRQTGRQAADRQTDKHTDRQMGRETEREPDRQTDNKNRQIGGQIHIEETQLATILSLVYACGHRGLSIGPVIAAGTD